MANAGSPEEAFTIDAEASGHPVTDVECQTREQHPGIFVCHGSTPLDAGDDPVPERWANVIFVDGDGYFHAYEGAIVADIVGEYVEFSEQPPQGTEIVNTAQYCIDWSTSNYGGVFDFGDDFNLHDDGHSIEFDDMSLEGAVGCFLEVLSLPSGRRSPFSLRRSTSVTTAWW